MARVTMTCPHCGKALSPRVVRQLHAQLAATWGPTHAGTGGSARWRGILKSKRSAAMRDVVRTRWAKRGEAGRVDVATVFRPRGRRTRAEGT
jgi:hypothetical protein